MSLTAPTEKAGLRKWNMFARFLMSSQGHTIAFQMAMSSPPLQRRGAFHSQYFYPSGGWLPKSISVLNMPIAKSRAGQKSAAQKAPPQKQINPGIRTYALGWIFISASHPHISALCRARQSFRPTCCRSADRLSESSFPTDEDWPQSGSWPCILETDKGLVCWQDS